LNFPITTAIVLFVVSIAASILINRILLKFSKNLGVRTNNNADLIRWSPTQKPSLGGISFFLVFLLTVGFAGYLGETSGILENKSILGLLVATTIGFFLGLADDAYNTIPWVKFLGQFVCGIVLVVFGVVIEISPFVWLNYVFTVLWVVGLMNSLNMLDNMDAITTSVSLIVILICLVISVLTSSINQTLLFVLIGVAGALFGFMVYNWHPSKMIMGDSGSQFLGAFTAAISIIYMWQFRDADARGIQVRQFIIPLLAFIMPIVDTVTVVIRRLARKQSPFVGGKDHTTHHLAYLGLKDNYVALVFILISIVSAVLIYISVSFIEEWKYWYSGLLVFYCLAVFFIIQVLYVKGSDKHLSKSAD